MKIANLLTITSAVIITVLIIFFGYLPLWTNPHDFKNYMFQYFKYDSIKVDMTEEQVQSIFDVTPALGTNKDYTYSKYFDEVLLYPTKLKTKPPDYILVFYMNGKVVGKQPSSQGKIRFDPNEFRGMVKESQHLGVRMILLMIAGSVATIGWFILFSRYNIIREGYKKSLIRILLSFCLLTSLSVLIFLGLNAFINIITALSI